MKIYTKTGDSGQTSLVGGQRVAKTCPRLESYGTVDELNSHLGLLAALCQAPSDVAFISRQQRALFALGGYLATDTSRREPAPGCVVTPEMVADVEREIDRLDATLPPLRSFVLPGGCPAAAQAHVCRTVCRRAERRVLALGESGAAVDTTATAYLNRLSDYLFTLARSLNAACGAGEKGVTLSARSGK